MHARDVSIDALVDRLEGDRILALAQAVLDGRLRYAPANEPTRCPDDTKTMAHLRLAALPHEVFAVFFLDTRHRLIAYEELFRGTLDAASVHPREVVRQALQYNAGAVILAHDHPSGDTSPSRADQAITRRVKEALALVGVRVLDHIVVGEDTVSFAEQGLL
jgi:DNA repair protein RadC